MADAKQQLVQFLEKKVFQPILDADGAKLSESQQRKLKEMQDKTRTEIERFKHYRSADEVVVNFKRDLHSEPAKKVDAQLQELGLPILPDVREEFEALADRLGH